MGYHPHAEAQHRVTAEKRISEQILNVLKPYASNWSGTLSRGDLVIPQREIPRLIDEILDSVEALNLRHGEVSDRDVFEALMSARSASSVQDQVAALRRHFVILAK